MYSDLDITKKEKVILRNKLSRSNAFISSRDLGQEIQCKKCRSNSFHSLSRKISAFEICHHHQQQPLYQNRHQVVSYPPASYKTISDDWWDSQPDLRSQNSSFNSCSISSFSVLGTPTPATPLSSSEENVAEPHPRFVKKYQTRPRFSNHHVLKQKLAYRSKSLTDIECMANKEDIMDARSDPDFSINPNRLQVLNCSSRSDRRGKLTKSTVEVSSQEFFSVIFDSPSTGEQVHEILPAIAGHKLQDSLQDLLQSHNIDIHSIFIYQDQSTPLLLHCDTGRLGGRRLCIKIKDSSPVAATPPRIIKSNSVKEKSDSRKHSTGSRNKKTALQRSFDSNGSPSGTQLGSGQDSGSQRSGKSKSKDQSRITGIFTNPFKADNEKLESLTEALNRYSNSGIPSLCSLLSFGEPDIALYHLESTWTDFVNANQLSERIHQQQNAIWELLQTEVNYISQLKIITDRFLLCLCNLQNEGHLNEIKVEKLFSNISDIYAVNRFFWKEHLLPMLLDARVHNRPLDPALMHKGFLQFEQQFQPYTKYCLDRDNCLHYVKERKHDNELFKAYVAWCETQKECNRQRFTDLLVKPMQRLTKYPLLLKAVHKTTECEERRNMLVAMISSVEKFVYSVNTSLHHHHEKERLLAISARVDSYEAVELKDDDVQKVLKQYLDLDLTCPMPGCSQNQTRGLLLEGDLKFRDSLKSSMDVHCFLFTDMLLICKTTSKRGDRVKVVRQPYLVDRLVVQEMGDRGMLLIIYLNEFHVATAVFTLSAGSETKIWLEHINKAKQLYLEAKQSISRRPILGLLTDDDEDYPTQALLIAQSVRSSRSSLVHSHSGSMEMSEPSSHAVSLELADLRASSASSDEGPGLEPKGSSGERALPVSPRAERRTIFFRSSGSSSPNTLNIYPESHRSADGETSSPMLLVPSPKALSPTSRSSSHPPPRVITTKLPSPVKPPLVKTKNVGPGGGGESFPPPEMDTIPIITGAVDGSPDNSDSESSHNKQHKKRALRTDRRYHTADSIENMKRERDPNIYKRFSLNSASGSLGSWAGRQQQQQSPNPLAADKYLSFESMHSSSGVSSTGSLHQSSDGEAAVFESYPPTTGCIVEAFNTAAAAATRLSRSHPSGAVRIDVSEMKDGISSVQISVEGSGSISPKTVKDLLLSDRSMEASEV